MNDDTDANYLRAAALAFQMDDPIRLRLMEIAERMPKPVVGDKELSVMAHALAAKNEAEQRELRAAQEADELRASLKAVVNHWREFGPDHGFDECIERAAGRRGIDAERLR